MSGLISKLRADLKGTDGSLVLRTAENGVYEVKQKDKNGNEKIVKQRVFVTKDKKDSVIPKAQRGGRASNPEVERSAQAILKSVLS